MRIYIIRHGDPDYATDSLTPEGVKEAEALSLRMEKEGLSHIYQSPLGRARETCSHTAKVTGISPVTLEWTRELSHLREKAGPFDTVVSWDIPGEILLPIEYGEYNSKKYDDFYPNETLVHTELEKLAEASDAFMEEQGYVREGTVYRILAKSDAQIAVFCHNGFGLSWAAHLLSIPYRVMWAGFWLAPSSVTTILMEERSSELAVPRALSIGDTSHLHAAGLPVRPRGIKANFN